MEDLNSTSSLKLFMRVWPNREAKLGGPLRSRICTTIAHNQTISSEDSRCYKLYQSLIYDWKCGSKDVGSYKR